MISSETSGVWLLNDAYHKDNAGYWTYVDQNGPYQMWVWGYNAYGDLGINDRAPRSSPVQMPGTWVDISTGYLNTHGVKSDGTLWSWGYTSASSGEIPINDVIPRSSPTQVPGTNWTAVTAHQYGGAALKTDGTLWTWGYNSNGECGVNDRVNYSSPKQIPGTDWRSVHGNLNAMLATKTDGTLWAWGAGGSNQLGGNGGGVQHSSPIQIPGTYWTTQVETVGEAAMAKKTDGTLWVWGNRVGGRLGLNSATGSNGSPVQLPGSWDKLGGSYLRGYATQTDGTLWSWGNNDNGELGHNNHGINYSSPKQIPGTSWAQVGGNGRYHTFGVKTDGTLWKWGTALDSAFPARSSPVQIPGTQWSTISPFGKEISRGGGSLSYQNMIFKVPV
tara:strand:- start:14176 stop:15339 length:1164 start_codon:yes stop_codon:yes gene_type:complete